MHTPLPLVTRFIKRNFKGFDSIGGPIDSARSSGELNLEHDGAQHPRNAVHTYPAHYTYVPADRRLQAAQVQDRRRDASRMHVCTSSSSSSKKKNKKKKKKPARGLWPTNGGCSVVFDAAFHQFTSIDDADAAQGEKKMKKLRARSAVAQLKLLLSPSDSDIRDEKRALCNNAYKLRPESIVNKLTGDVNLFFFFRAML